MLPARDEYIVDTSEFDQVKSRLASIENSHKLQNDKDNKDRPTLRRATADNPSDNGNSNGKSNRRRSSNPEAQRRLAVVNGITEV